MFIIVGLFISILSIATSYNSPPYINYMTKKHHKLVPYYGNKYLNKVSIPIDEKQNIIQEGYIGLYYAARKYNCSKNVSFSYYSKFWIMRYFSVALKKYNEDKTFNLPLNENVNHNIVDNKLDDMEIYTYMQKLKPYHQEIIYRRYIKHEKVKNMAECYDISRNTMSNDLCLAIQYLRLLYRVN